MISIQEMGYRNTSFGLTLYIKVRMDDYCILTWAEVWQAFSESYPDQWAVQFFPPAAEILDEVNIYHLFVLEEAPAGVIVWRL